MFEVQTNPSPVQKAFEAEQNSRLYWILWGIAAVVFLLAFYLLGKDQNVPGDGGIDAAARNQILIAFPLIAAGIERLLELAFTWYESANLAFGHPLKTGSQSDLWPVVEVRAVRGAMDQAAQTLAALDPADPAFDTALAAFETAAQHLGAANTHVEESLKNPLYVNQKKLISLFASLGIGILLAVGFELRLFNALGFISGKYYLLDYLLTGMLLGAGAGPAHGIIEALIALRSMIGLGALRRPAPAPAPAEVATIPATNGIDDDFQQSAPFGNFEEAEHDEELSSLAAAEMSQAEAERIDPEPEGQLDEHVAEYEAERIAPWLTLTELASGGAVTALSESSPFGRGVIGIESTKQDFRDKVVEICRRLGIRPLYLMAVMSFETGGTFAPDKRNRLSGATGLIQFMDATASTLGTTTAKLAGMTAVDQLDFVEKYFRPFRGRLRTLEDTYMAVLWPAAIGRGPNAVLFRRGTRAYLQNSGLDLNRDGLVTVAEAAEKVRRRIL